MCLKFEFVLDFRYFFSFHLRVSLRQKAKLYDSFFIRICERCMQKSKRLPVNNIPLYEFALKI